MPDNFTSGLIGSLITAMVTLFIYFHTYYKKGGKAHKVLRELKKHFESTKGDYCYTKTTDDNRQVAHQLYMKTDKEIIATAFNENPAIYGIGDFAQHFQPRNLTRITCSDICDTDSQIKAATNLKLVHSGGILVVLPSGINFMKIDGMFCKFDDETYLAFLSFRNPQKVSQNTGLVLMDTIAERFYDYYKALANEYYQI
jgi:hypothetical protein